jgi:hypothetical protein
MAQFVRLAHGIDAGKPVERPAVVASRYARGVPPRGPKLRVAKPRPARGARLVVTGTTTAARVTATSTLGRVAVTPRRGRFTLTVRIPEGPSVVSVVAVSRFGGTAVQQLSVARRP